MGFLGLTSLGWFIVADVAVLLASSTTAAFLFFKMQAVRKRRGPSGRRRGHLKPIPRSAARVEPPVRPR